MEKDLERKIVRHCKKLGLRTSKFIDQSRRGAPDRIVWFPQRFLLLIETKFGPNGPSKHQMEYHRLLRKEGHRVVCSNDETVLINLITEFGKALGIETY